MRIRHIYVNGLFGVFDHDIPLNTDDRITIIHGPNGFGKTAILRLIDGLFNSNYSELRTIPFKEFSVIFDDESVLKVVKTISGEQDESPDKPSPKLTISYNKSGESEESFDLRRLDKGAAFHLPASDLQHLIPGIERVGGRAWRYIPTNEILSFEDILERFSDILPKRVPRTKFEPEWFGAIRNAIHIRFIQTQRLLTLSTSRPSPSGLSKPMTSVVAEYSVELGKAIQYKLREYASLSQSLDRTFPARLVKEVVLPDLTSEALRSELSELEEKRNELTAAGLLDKEGGDFQIPENIDDERTKGVLSVYIKDVQKKLSVFDEMAAKIDLFKKIINERFEYKEMTISKDSGITFTTYDGVPLSPTSLSSGEQHELVLLYEFLFKVKPDSLILIDEPEISLHIAWQEQFLRDLQQITDLASFDVLIATHSPQIIYDRWDLTVELKGPKENERTQQRDELEPATATASMMSTD